MGLNYQLLFQIIIVFTIIQRISELFLAKRNEKVILNNGGKIIKETNYLFMVILHTSWLLCLFYYAFFTIVKVNHLIFYTFFILFLIGQALRITAIRTLGSRWSTRIVILPDAPAINNGIFKLFRHPNYLGVVIELFSLPLMILQFEVAIIFSLSNFVILFYRIKLEEYNLKKYNNYSKTFNLKENNV